MLSGVRTYASTVVLGFLIFYFGFHALTGERGLLAGQQRRATLAARNEALEGLRQERADLEARVRLLNDNSLSDDLLQERAQTLLGFAAPNDYVIRLPPSAG